MPFQKGKSGNPGGRKAIPADVKAAFAAACPKAVDTLVALLDSKNEPIRLRAAEVIITRHLGPAQVPQQQADPAEQQRRFVVLDSEAAIDEAAVDVAE